MPFDFTNDPAVETLGKVAEIVEDAWTRQRHCYVDPQGGSRYCLMGAVGKAIGLTDERMVDLGSASDVVIVEEAPEVVERLYKALPSRFRRVRDELYGSIRLISMPMHIEHWNDSQGSRREILALIQRAINNGEGE